MSFNPRFLLRSFGKDGPQNVQILLALLRALTETNVIHMRKHGVIPLYGSGVYYKREPYGVENWSDQPTVFRRGHGDCEDLSAWLCAQYQLSGIAAEPFVKAPKLVNGGRVLLYHIQVIHPSGRIEDPSSRLGMGLKPSWKTL